MLAESGASLTIKNPLVAPTASASLAAEFRATHMKSKSSILALTLLTLSLPTTKACS